MYDNNNTSELIAIIIIFLGGNTMRALRKGIAIALCAAMVITVAPAGSADAAKKPKLNKPKTTIAVGGKVKLTVKNGAKKAKVTWKSSKKAVAKVVAKKKAKKPTATVTGKKEGKAKITATYKAGKTKKKLVCKVTVSNEKANNGGQQTGQTVAPTQGTNSNGQNNPNNPDNPNGPDASDNPAGPTPTKGPTATPKPSPTPSNVPKNGSLTATKVADGTAIDVTDGTQAAGEAWEDAFPQDLITDKKTLEYGVRGGETTITGATVKLMWDDANLYALVNVTKPNAGDGDSVTVYAADDAKATDIKKATSDKVVTTDTGYTAEVSVPISAKEVGGSVAVDIQINEGNTTVNYFDTWTEMKYDADKDEWSLVQSELSADKDASVLGAVELLAAMEQPTTAYHTDEEEAILAAAAVKKADPVYADSDTEQANELYPGAHTMNFVDPAYWTKVYENAQSPSIVFTKQNVPEYMGNAEQSTWGLQANNRESAQAYTIWSENYLYVLYDITDNDISPAAIYDGNTSQWAHFATDSVEFFLDEDYARNETYVGKEVQIRVDAANSAFTCKNDAEGAESTEGTDPYDMIAYAVNYKHADGTRNDDITDATGYMVEMIIKLNGPHKAGDMMGMDLQINDCYTTEVETTDTESGEPTVEKQPARATTLTAYDQTNNAYQYPNCFGRIKLQ